MTATRLPTRLVRLSAALGLFGVLTFAGCASMGDGAARPVLYPNTAYKTMGEAAANQHLSQCLSLAQSSGLRPLDSNNSVASGATMGAAVAGRRLSHSREDCWRSASPMASISAMPS